MVGIAKNWKQRAESAFAPLRSIDRSWFPDALNTHGKLLDAAAMSTTARRLLYSYLLKGDTTPMQGPVSVPDWAHLDAAQLRRLVLRLGAFACATPLSQTIEQSNLIEVRSAVGDETYCEAVKRPRALIENDIRADFRTALERGELRFFVAGIGMSVLQCAVRQDDAYIKHRLRFYFPRKVWAQRRTDLICRTDHVIEILNGAANV